MLRQFPIDKVAYLLFVVMIYGCKTTHSVNDQFAYEIETNRKNQTLLSINLPYEKVSRKWLCIFLAEFTKPNKEVENLKVYQESTLLWEISQVKKNEHLLAIPYGKVPKGYQQLHPKGGEAPVPLQSNQSYLVEILTENGQNHLKIDVL